MRVEERKGFSLMAVSELKPEGHWKSHANQIGQTLQD